MKKTVYINLNGFAFHVEEDAYEKLKQYLDKIEKSFPDAAEGKEIIADIEARIAELFRGKHPLADEVISLANVEEVIETMGEPHDIVDDENITEDKHKVSSSEEESSSYRKRLYRDSEKGMLGGVCSGLGAYFNTDPIVFRIIFLLSFLLYGVSFLPYIVMWIVMPKAVTITQRLEMKGPAEYEKWEQNFQNEYKNVSSRIKESKVYHDLNKGFDKSSDVLGLVLSKIVQVVGAIIGVVFMLVSLICLVSLIMVFTFGFTMFGFADVDGIYAALPIHFLSPLDAILGIIALILFIGIPLLTIFYWGFKLVFNFKTRSRILSILGIILWGAGWVLLSYSAARVARNYSVLEDISEIQVLEIPSQAKTLYIKPNPDSNIPDYKEHLFDLNKLDIYRIDEKIFIEGNPDVWAERGDEFGIKIKKSARGRNYSQAKENCQSIEYFWIQKDSIIYIDPTFTISENSKIRDQKARVIISVPEGYNIDVDEELKWVVNDNLD